MQARDLGCDCFLALLSVLLPSSNLGAAFESIPEIPDLVVCLGGSLCNGASRGVVGEFRYPRIAGQSPRRPLPAALNALSDDWLVAALGSGSVVVAVKTLLQSFDVVKIEESAA